MNRILFSTMLTTALLGGTLAAQSVSPSGPAGSAFPADDTHGEVVELEEYVAVANATQRANVLVNSEILESTAPTQNVLNILNTLPGVSVNQGDAFGGDDWSTSISMRGFQTTRDSSQLGYTVDGLPNGNTNYGGGTKPNRFVEPENVQAVSVSQGSADIGSPAAQALGGTIEYRTVEPTLSAGATASVAFGDHNARRFFGRYNTGLLGGHTRAWVSVSKQYQNRWMDIGGQGYTDRFHISARSLSDLGALELGLRFSYDDVYENNYDSVTLDDYAANPRWDGLTGEWTGRPAIDQNYILGWATVRENTLISARLGTKRDEARRLRWQVEPYLHHQDGRGDWVPPYLRMGWDEAGNPVADAPFAAVQARAFFQDADGNLLPVGDPSEAPEGVVFYTPSDPFDIESYPEEVREGTIPVQSFRTSLYGFDRYGATFSAEFDVNEDNTLLAGGWIERLDRDWARSWQKIIDTRIGYAWDRRPYWYDFKSKLTTDTLQLYIQDTMRLGSLTLAAGLKTFFVDIGYRDLYGVRDDREWNSDSDLLPSVGFTWDLGEDRGQVFGNFARNFSAIVDEIITREVSPSLEPETADSFDLGYRIARGGFAATASAYYAKFDNRIVFVTPRTEGGVTEINYDIGQGGGYVNVGGIESKGLELAVNADISRSFGTYWAMTLNDSQYTRSVPENGVVGGNEVAGSPGFMLNGSVFYRSGPFHAVLSGKYTGERYGTLDNGEKLPAFTVFDLALTYRFVDGGQAGLLRNASAGIRIQNLLDEEYLAGIDGGASVSRGYYFIGAPRTAMFTLSFEL